MKGGRSSSGGGGVGRDRGVDCQVEGASGVGGGGRE